MDLTDIIKAIKLRKERGDYVFVCGNGGSASTAEHFTNDLFSKGVRAICLNSNVSIMTMIANDYGYDYVFSRQLDVYSEPDDLIIAFSCSGKSKNISKLFYIIETIEIFGKEEESFQEAENRHLSLAHEISNAI